MKQSLLKLKEFLLGRQSKYRLVFDPENLAVKDVMDDLEKFCRGKTTSFHPDPRIHAMLEGRREVYLRIRDHLDLDSESLWNKYNPQGEINEHRTNNNTRHFDGANTEHRGRANPNGLDSGI